MERQAETTTGRPGPEPAFTRVVCGIDGSAAAIEAARQAAALTDDAAPITLVTAVDPLNELWNAPPFSALETAARVQEQAEEMLATARAAIDRERPVETTVVEAQAAAALLDEAGEDPSCLLAVGAPVTGRIAGIVRGAVATELLHRATCPLLVARMPAAGLPFPQSIVAGLDGSPQSAAAFATAAALARRLGVGLTPVVALGGRGADLEAVQQIVGGRLCKRDERAPAAALAAAVEESDLLVVGSRGLHGLAALGSVSEQVAHQAPSSVLVVNSG